MQTHDGILLICKLHVSTHCVWRLKLAISERNPVSTVFFRPSSLANTWHETLWISRNPSSKLWYQKKKFLLKSFVYSKRENLSIFPLKPNQQTQKVLFQKTGSMKLRASVKSKLRFGCHGNSSLWTKGLLNLLFLFLSHSFASSFI